MPASRSLRNLTTVMGSFHGRVLAARLGAEGIVVVLKGLSDGPYPLQGAVEVLVPAEELELAREILLADAVEDALADASTSVAALADSSTFEVAALVDSSTFEVAAPLPEEPQGPSSRRARVRGAPAALVVVVVITLLVVAFVAAAH